MSLLPTLRSAGCSLLALLWGCLALAQTPQAKLPRIPDSCDAFCDIQLAVMNSEADANGTFSVRLAAIHKQEILGFRIVFVTSMVGGFLNPQTEMPDLRSVNRGGIRFERTGPESDRFLSALAKLYDSKLHPRHMEKEIRFDAYAARGNPSDLKIKPVSFRVFHLAAAGTGAQYEFLLDVNLPEGEIRLREINQDFRDDLIQTLASLEAD